MGVSGCFVLVLREVLFIEVGLGEKGLVFGVWGISFRLFRIFFGTYFLFLVLICLIRELVFV